VKVKYRFEKIGDKHMKEQAAITTNQDPAQIASLNDIMQQVGRAAYKERVTELCERSTTQKTCIKLSEEQWRADWKVYWDERSVEELKSYPSLRCSKAQNGYNCLEYFREVF
jgi:hypothetical protein